MAEKYIESIIIRDDCRPEVDEPMIPDSDCDAIFRFKARIKLVQINKSVQNAIHNRQNYVFKIVEIRELHKEDE